MTHGQPHRARRARRNPLCRILQIRLLSAGGTAILLSGFFAVPFMPKYSFGKAVACFFSTIYQLRFPVLTIATISVWPSS